MFLREERPLCDYPYPYNPQPKNYSCCPQPGWKDTVHLGQPWDGVAGGETELSSLEVRVSLQGRELWEQFGDLGTEMLITKTGRRMFPSCKVTVTGLNPRAKYVLMMDMVPFDDNKYKWSKDRWEVSGMTEPHLPNRFYIHPDSPSLGESWMQYPVSFHKLKLTNNTLNSNGLVILHSMHKYLPRLHVVQSPDPCSSQSAGYLRFTFPEAAFIAVTAYQNTEITKLKIDNNPFAKGFRDNGLNRKRFREKEKTLSNKDIDGQQQIKPSNVSRPVATDDEDDVTVSSSVDFQATECRPDYTSSSPAPECRPDYTSSSPAPECRPDYTSSSIAPNPFISAFMNRGGGASQPCRQGGWANGPTRTHSSYTVHSSRDYSPVHSDARVTGFPNMASPLFSHTTLGQTHTGSVGFRRPPPQSGRATGPPHHPSLCAPDLPQHLPPDHQVALQEQQAEFDYPLPLPPKVSRMQLSESALRCLEKNPVSDSGSPQPLSDILNRIHRLGAPAPGSPGKLLQAQYARLGAPAPGSPGKLLQAQYARLGAPAPGSPGKLLQAQYARLGLGLDREMRPQPYPAPLEPAGHCLPLQSLGLYQNSLMGSAGPPRDNHVDPRDPSSSLEYPYKTAVLDFLSEDQNGK